MVNVDLSAVTVALPAMQRDLASSLESGQWVVNGYLLALAALTVPAGRLADVLGRRRVFLSALALFAIASMAGAAAPSIGWLVASRIVQGAAGAALLPTAVAIVASVYPPQERRGPMSRLLVAASVAAAVGPLLGGAVTEVLGWRMLLAANVPIAATVLLAAQRMPRDGHHAHERLDARAVALLAAAMAAVVLGLERSDTWGWASARLWTVLAAGVALCVAFALFDRSRPSPLLDPMLLRRRAFAGATVVGSLAFFGAIPFDLLIAQYAQQVLGFGPLTAGAVLLPTSLAVALTAPAASRLADRVGSRAPVVAGLGLMAVSLVLASDLDPHAITVRLATALVLMGIGLGACIGLLGTAAVNAVATTHAGVASGVGQAARMLGASSGIAVCVAVFHAAERSRLESLSGSASPEIFAAALRSPFLLAAGAVAAAALLALLTVRDPPRRRAPD